MFHRYVIRHIEHEYTRKYNRSVLINNRRKGTTTVYASKKPKRFNYMKFKTCVIATAMRNYVASVKNLYRIKTQYSHIGRWKWEPHIIRKKPIFVVKSLMNSIVKNRHYMVDLSNIIRGAKNYTDHQGKERILSKFGLFRLFGIDCHGITEKPGISCSIAGSVGSNEFTEAEAEAFIGLGCNVLRQNTSGKEMGVDDFLHTQIQMLIAQPGSHKPGDRLLVLATGDGNDNSGKSNFPECIHIAASNGFLVEIWCWKSSLSANISATVSMFPLGQIKIKFLDSVIEKVLEPMTNPVDGIDPYYDSRCK